MADPPKKITKVEWLARGTELFGPDFMQWEFVCPACKNVQKVSDFEQYKNVGATPNDAYFNCIGRFDGHMNTYMGTDKPCNYSGGGLFRLNPVIVVDEEGKEHQCFAFNEPGEQP